MAMRKTSYSSNNNLSAQRKLLAYRTEARKAALKNLEDVLLEPPRAASGKSRRYLKKTRYLPDLMGDSLEGYPRRVFIDVGLPEKEGGSGTGWFAKNYPTRNLDFDMYKIETVTEVSSGKECYRWKRPRGHGGKGNNGGRRAYWECLALYGRLRDEGVAVHQWWG
ncbi:hypothetical protein GH714_003311 [Hevea brasiliensis]|uniref:DUF7870 domain-containing protein n=1 Tax=Hevea brasiliensis TaxID=3981 RepID=A0A6A6LH03_HEVBR|nr:hypothetical protein GH714_003311 [Hevea brasiliensis]